MRLVSAPASGLFVQKIGERRVYVSGLLIVAVSTGACAFAQTYWQLLLFRSLGGLGSAMFTVSSLGLMIRISPPDARGRVSGMFSSGFLVGSVGGAVLGSVAAGGGAVWAVFFCWCPRVGLRGGGCFGPPAPLRWRGPGAHPRTRRFGACRPSSSRVPRRAVLQLRDGVGGVRPAHRTRAAVRRRSARLRCRFRGFGAGDVRDREH